MRTIHRKLLRDLAALKGQVAAIGVVIAAGVMLLILAVTTLDAITLSKERFYQTHQFARVFTELTRAPEGVRGQLANIPGVAQVETRVQAPVRLQVPGFADPVRGLMLSIPDGRQPTINRLHLREGDLPEPGRWDQVLLNEPFAEAHGLRAGDEIHAIIRGRLETLIVSGISLSPEFIYQIGPADLLPDYQRYGVMWMNRRALANAYGMDGAFNSAAFTLQANADEAAVIAAADQILARYGSIGAYARDEQISHNFLSEELAQLRVMATVLPALFLGVAAFLLNLLMGRIIRNQQQQIAVLKAFGYSNRDIGLHYGLLTGLIVIIGAVTGIAFGAWAAEHLAALYTEYFRFPEISFRLQVRAMLLGIGVAGVAALLGTWRAVSRAVRLPPAEAMRPPLPESFRQGWLEQSRLGRSLGVSSRIIVRNLTRHRLKSALSVLGIGLSGALLFLGSYQINAVDHLIDVQYRLVLKADTHVTLTDPTSARALYDVRSLPGVQHAESYRAVPVRLRHGLNEYRTAITGMDADAHLRGLIDRDHRPVALPPEGLLLTDYLADHMGLASGDTVEVEIMEGQRRTVQVPVAAVVAEPIGIGTYMERGALNNLMREGPAITGIWLLVDQDREQEIFARLWDMPRIASIGQIAQAEASLREYIADTVLVLMGVLLVLAGSIAFAVVYNNARIAFAERARELATLRVLGFTRGEVAWVLMGEMLLLVLLAIPVAWAIGFGFARLLNEALQMEIMRIPFVIGAETPAFAALGLMIAAALSMGLIARRLHRIDMVSALKTVE